MHRNQRPQRGKSQYTALVFAFCAIAWAVIVGKAVLYEAPPREVISTDAELTQFAKRTLDEIQSRSFAENREFCGLIFEDDDGALSTSEIHEGSQSECSFSWDTPMGQHAIATFHTHGGFDNSYDGEAPSLIDLQTDIESRKDGFVATPGGRLWRIDWQDEIATQICGLSCIAQDPHYKPCYSFQPVEKYTVAELLARTTGDGGECSPLR